MTYINRDEPYYIDESVIVIIPSRVTTYLLILDIKDGS